MNLPNKLTVARLVAVPVIMVCMALEAPWAAWAVFALFVLACITDFLDGQIARKRNLVTDLGKFLDPLADKVLVCTVLTCFVASGYAHPAAVIIVLFREFVVSGIRMNAADKGRVVAANIYGKIKTLFQMVSLSAVLFFRALTPGAEWLPLVSNICVWIIAAITAVSGVTYVIQNRDVIKE